MIDKNIHVSVMQNRCIELLSSVIDNCATPVIVDATLGLGGHTEALLAKFSTLQVIGIDRDSAALEIARRRLVSYASRLHTSHTTFDNIEKVVNSFGYHKISGAILRT